MHFETPHLKINTESGIATLWLNFPDTPANALDLARLRDLDTALGAVAATRSIRILVIRSAHSGGFCAGLHPEVLARLNNPADRAAFSWYGQQVFDRLAGLETATLAFLEGACLGAGLELALACDYRLCLARPSTHLGFPDRLTCFGGGPRVQALIGRAASGLIASGETLSGREAQAMKLVDLAFCERRSRIELRSFLDCLERRPTLPRRKNHLTGFASERRAFASSVSRPVARSLPIEIERPINPLPPFPGAICVLGHNAGADGLAAAATLNGSRVLVTGSRSAVLREIDVHARRGFITPLEAEQARQRVVVSSSPDDYRQAGLVIVGREHSSQLLQLPLPLRAIVGVIEPPLAALAQPKVSPGSTLGNGNPRQPRVVGFRFGSGERIELHPTPSVDSDALPTLASWLKILGYQATILPPGQSRSVGFSANTRMWNDCDSVPRRVG